MILGRELYRNIKIGCCGLSRYDNIFPVDNKEDFMNDAKRMIMKYYMPTYDGGNDIYSIEYFEGNFDQTERGDGLSYYKMELQDNDEWHYFENSTEMKIYSKDDFCDKRDS